MSVRYGVVGADWTSQIARVKIKRLGVPWQDTGIYCLIAARHFFSNEPVGVAACRTNCVGSRCSEVEEAIAIKMNFPACRLAQTAYLSNCILAPEAQKADGNEGMADVAILRADQETARSGTVQQLSLRPRPIHPSANMLRRVKSATRRLVF